MRKSYTTKTPPGDFKVTTPENSLLSQQAVTSKQVKKSQYLISIYSWTLTPIPNWTCSVLTISPFQCMAPSMWLTNSIRGSQYTAYSPTWERCSLQNSSVHQTMKITKLLGLKILRWINTTTSSRERWTRTNSVFSPNLHEHNFASHSRHL